jgi:hypothetical protein
VPRHSETAWCSCDRLAPFVQMEPRDSAPHAPPPPPGQPHSDLHYSSLVGATIPPQVAFAGLLQCSQSGEKSLATLVVERARALGLPVPDPLPPPPLSLRQRVAAGLRVDPRLMPPPPPRPPRTQRNAQDSRIATEGYRTAAATSTTTDTPVGMSLKPPPSLRSPKHHHPYARLSDATPDVPVRSNPQQPKLQDDHHRDTRLVTRLGVTATAADSPAPHAHPRSGHQVCTPVPLPPLRRGPILPSPVRAPSKDELTQSLATWGGPSRRTPVAERLLSDRDVKRRIDAFAILTYGVDADTPEIQAAARKAAYPQIVTALDDAIVEARSVAIRAAYGHLPVGIVADYARLCADAADAVVGAALLQPAVSFVLGHDGRAMLVDLARALHTHAFALSRAPRAAMLPRA